MAKIAKKEQLKLRQHKANIARLNTLREQEENKEETSRYSTKVEEGEEEEEGEISRYSAEIEEGEERENKAIEQR